MFLKKALYITSIFITILFSACSSDDAEKAADTVSMPVTLAIPATDGAVTRAGDPGQAEQLTLPKYAYIYIVCKDPKGNDVVVHSFFQLDDEWKKTHYTGAMATAGDSIYQYTGDIHVYLPINRMATGKVYTALSTVPLEGLPTGSNSTGETEETVQNYKFKLRDDVCKELANIYSTPYNYRPDGTTYYGTMNDLNTLTPHLDIILYHTAARLDLQWNVDENIQSSTAIKSIALSLPSAESCYIFKPLETEPETSTTRTETITTNIGTQWYGRQSTYVIPMTGANSTYTFDATATLTNGTTTRTSNTTVEAGVINKNQPFTPWMRGTITVR